MWNEKDLSNYIPAIQGLFSGSVLQYYLSNRSAFDDANAHGGLFIISTEMCPFTTFKEFGVSIDTLAKMREMLPDNKNIEYLCELRDHIPACNLQETFVYAFCGCLYRKLVQFNFSQIDDIASYAAISEWIYNIDSTFNLTVNIQLDRIWQVSEKLSLDCISTLMYISFCGNKDAYLKFSIFDLYCADALKPTVNLLSSYTVPDDAHKEMPIRNLVIMFHQNLTSLWNKTIMSNYEFDTVTEWLEYWFDVRSIFACRQMLCLYLHTSWRQAFREFGRGSRPTP